MASVTTDRLHTATLTVTAAGESHEHHVCNCSCHYLAMLPGGGVHDYCERCDGPRPAYEPLSHPGDD